MAKNEAQNDLAFDIDYLNEDTSQTGGNERLDKHGRLLVRMVELLIRHRPHELNYSQISRFTKCPRSTLYYYFGRDHMKALEEAVRFGMLHFTRRNSMAEARRFRNWKEFYTAELNSSIELVKRYPWAPKLFFRYRTDPGPLGDVIRQSVDEFLKDLTKVWKYFNGNRVKAENNRIAASITLGFLWGVAMEWSAHKKGYTKSFKFDQDKLVKKLTDLTTELFES